MLHKALCGPLPCPSVAHTQGHSPQEQEQVLYPSKYTRHKDYHTQKTNKEEHLKTKDSSAVALTFELHK